MEKGLLCPNIKPHILKDALGDEEATRALV
jgi:hypothetical protein